MTLQPPGPGNGPRPAPPRQPNPRPQAPPTPPQQQSAAKPPISPQPQRDSDPRRPVNVVYRIPVATTEFLPGREIVDVIGLVIGVSTRPRDMAHNPEMSFINTAARQEAVAAMVQLALESGADAVVGVRFNSGKISETVSELTAYGTAVRLRR